MLPASAMAVVYVVPIFAEVGESQFGWNIPLVQWDRNGHNIVHPLQAWSGMADFGAVWNRSI
jgi:hypothetical protein